VVSVRTSVAEIEKRKLPADALYHPDVVSVAHVRPGAPIAPLSSSSGACIPPSPERLRESVMADARSASVLLAHVEEITVDVTTGLPGVYRLYVPLELRGTG
jgi:hypothetical protein